MHGLIFVTWEKYLAERFGSSFLGDYRKEIGETPSTAPLASRLYGDDVLLAGVGAAHHLTGIAVDTLLHEYGRYFIINGLTSHLCAGVLAEVHSGRELLLTMRDVHARLRLSHTGVTPPLFNYEISSTPNTVRLIYDSPRKLCSVLWGAIEGAAERYNERVSIVERSCMKHGAQGCLLEAHFSNPTRDSQQLLQTPEQAARTQRQRELTGWVLAVLPEYGTSAVPGATLADIQVRLQEQGLMQPYHLRPAVLLEAIQHLQFAGRVRSNADQPADMLVDRRYWRVRTYWDR